MTATGLSSRTASSSSCPGTLSQHKRPREVVFVGELPRNAMGKVQKKLLTD